MSQKATQKQITIVKIDNRRQVRKRSNAISVPPPPVLRGVSALQPIIPLPPPPDLYEMNKLRERVERVERIPPPPAPPIRQAIPIATQTEVPTQIPIATQTPTRPIPTQTPVTPIPTQTPAPPLPVVRSEGFTQTMEGFGDIASAIMREMGTQTRQPTRS